MFGGTNDNASIKIENKRKGPPSGPTQRGSRANSRSPSLSRTTSLRKQNLKAAREFTHPRRQEAAAFNMSASFGPGMISEHGSSRRSDNTSKTLPRLHNAPALKEVLFDLSIPPSLNYFDNLAEKEENGELRSGETHGEKAIPSSKTSLDKGKAPMSSEHV